MAMTDTYRILPPAGRLLGAASLLTALAGCVGAPAVVQPTGYGTTCYAGTYVCQLGAQIPVGSQCTCPGIGAPSFGAVR
jgi:hypothetical protein